MIIFSYLMALYSISIVGFFANLVNLMADMQIRLEARVKGVVRRKNVERVLPAKVLAARNAAALGFTIIP